MKVLDPCYARPSPKKAGDHRPARINILLPYQTILPGDLGKLISWNATIVAKLGWGDFVNQSRGRGNFAILGAILHPACRLLH